MSEPTTMVERMARAMCCGWHSGGGACDAMGDPHACQAIHEMEKVRAVLQAMRDQPSEAMVAALRPMTDATIGPGRFEVEAVIRDWRILLDAALKEGES